MGASFSTIIRLPFAGIAISITVVLLYWSSNVMRLGWENVWFIMLIVAGITAGVTCLLFLINRNTAETTIGVALFAIYFFYCPPLIGSIGMGPLYSKFAHLLTIFGLWMLYRRMARLRDLTSKYAIGINLVSAFTLAATAIPMFFQIYGLERARLAAADTIAKFDGIAKQDSPDVWHIVLDRYAANTTLRSEYFYENRPFLDALRDRQFDVNENAFSNYQRTGPSIASTMNGAYLTSLSEPMSEQGDDWVPIYRAMRDSAAIEQFNIMGYRTIFAGSWWEPTRFSSAANQSVKVRAMPQLARLLIDQSAIGFWLSRASLPWLDGRQDQCYRANEKVRRLVDIAAQRERKMVFAHFLVPHPPFVLNSDGSCRSLKAAKQASRRDNYVNQINFANKRTIELIDAILGGPRPAVIVLHSDEGPWPKPYVGNEHGMGTDPVPVPWGELNPRQLHEKFAILMAIRVPDGTKLIEAPDSPVKIYPLILREYFQSKIHVPISRSLIYKSEKALYQFEDVSKYLKAPKPNE